MRGVWRLTGVLFSLTWLNRAFWLVCVPDSAAACGLLVVKVNFRKEKKIDTCHCVNFDLRFVGKEILKSKFKKNKKRKMDLKVFLTFTTCFVFATAKGVCEEQNLESEFCSCYSDTMLICNGPSSEKSFELCEGEPLYPENLFFTQIFVNGETCKRLLENLARLNYREITFRDAICPSTFHSCRFENFLSFFLHKSEMIIT